MEHFDWVSARHQCSVAIMFRLLREHVEADVKKRQALRIPVDPTAFRFEDDGAFAFFVFKERPSSSNSVKFTLQNERIAAFDDNHRELASATVSLDRNGQCKLFVADQCIEEWEFRKRALDDLFFVEPKVQPQPVWKRQ